MTDIGKLAAFICARNTGDQLCGYVGSTLEDVMHDLSDGMEEASLVLYEGERITGVVILDIYDVGDGQEDIEVWGPYYSAHPEEELRLLFNYVSETAEAGAIRYIHLFISGDNTPLMEYAARYQAEKVNTHYHYSIATASAPDSSRHMHPGLSVLPVTEPASRWTGQILDLHNQQFQGAILTPKEITAEIEDSSNSEYDVHAVLNEGRFTGYIIVRRNARTGTLHLEYLCIGPEERSRGIGRQLIAYLAEKYKGLGYSSISLVVSEENTAAIRFYDKNGFNRDRVMKHILVGGGMF
ncbi:GNAT family N-acetyltransferase [Paenibacillus sp. FSL M7-0896]|uniref:GNAT family N-acetyltransferase n=1 Tax=Paenibacillus sp. FSL M7-0896 TaxID=2921610 RepID=UPI0030DBA21D